MRITWLQLYLYFSMETTFPSMVVAWKSKMDWACLTLSSSSLAAGRTSTPMAERAPIHVNWVSLLSAPRIRTRWGGGRGREGEGGREGGREKGEERKEDLDNDSAEAIVSLLALQKYCLSLSSSFSSLGLPHTYLYMAHNYILVLIKASQGSTKHVHTLGR